MVFGIGINDLTSQCDAYTVWHSMLRRCYSKVYQANKPTYIGTIVHPDWHRLSIFERWFRDNYVSGWQLDKELLSGFSKVYSEDNCCFLPGEINSALYFDRGKNGLPPGVSFKTNNNKYVAQYSRKDVDGKRRSVHLICSSDPVQCYEAYKEAKEKYLQELAERFKFQLSPRAYDALITIQV